MFAKVQRSLIDGAVLGEIIGEWWNF